MKRSAEPSGSDNSRTQKRPKSSQACSSCRKHKTRCELIDDLSVGPYRCHRCKVLNVSCSFESSDFAPPIHEPSPAPQSRTVSQTLEPPRHEPARIPPRDSPRDSHASPATIKEGSHLDQQIKPEDLVPVPPHAPWGFEKVPGGFDWTATPMLAMQKLTIRTPGGEEPFVNDINAKLANIISQERIKTLLSIFEANYSPWLNLQPHQGGSSPVLVLARCLVASRHLDPTTRSAVVPQLQKLTEDVILRHIFNPMPTTESIQAVLILSLWSPIGGPSHGEVRVRDGRLLIASAVSMAMNMRLSQAVEYVATLREEMTREKKDSDSVIADLEDATEKVRLWLALINVESMLCLGTGRTPLSHRTALDHAVIDSSLTNSIESSRDVRLELMGQIFEITEGGLQLHLPGAAALPKFYREVTGVLMKLDNILRMISPLPIVAENELFYFHILQIYHHSCRLLFIHHCLRETRRVISDETGRPWHEIAHYNGINLGMQWGHEALILAEEILSSTLSRSELNQLSTAPDNVFAMICFAASFLVICKLSIYQQHGEQLPGSSDALLSKITDRLLQAACGPDHAPAKCAQLISGLVARFESQTKGGSNGADGLRMPTIEHNISSERTSASYNPGLSSTGYGVDSQPAPYDANLPTFGSVDLNRIASSEVMLDSDFWSSFMDNLTADVPSMVGS